MRIRTARGRGGRRRATTGLLLAGVLMGGGIAVAQDAAPPELAQSLGAGAESAHAATPAGFAPRLSSTGFAGRAAGWTIEGQSGIFYCLTPGAPGPTGKYGSQNVSSAQDLNQIIAANPVAPAGDGEHGVTPDTIAGIANVISAYGQDPGNHTQIAAVAFAVKWAWNAQAAWGASEGSAPFIPGAAGLHRLAGDYVNSLSSVGSAEIGGSADLAVSYLGVIESTAVASVATPTLGVAGAVDARNNYEGSLTLSPSQAGGTAGVTLTNAVFTSTGTSTWTGTLNGATALQLRGVPPVGQGTYDIGYSYSYEVTGAPGWAGLLDIATTPSDPSVQTLVTAASSSARLTSTPTASTSGSGGFRTSALFAPVVVTNIGSSYYKAGDTVSDLWTWGLGTQPDGAVNEWYRSPGGDFSEVTASWAAYQSPSEINPGEGVPADAVAIANGHVTAGGTSQNPVGTNSTISFPTQRSGYVTIVATIDVTGQDAAVQPFLPAGYTWSSQFGDPAETALVTAVPTTSAQPEASPGSRFSDTIVAPEGVYPKAGLDVKLTAHLVDGETASGNDQCTAEDVLWSSPAITVTTAGNTVITSPELLPIDSVLGGTKHIDWTEEIMVHGTDVVLTTTTCSQSAALGEWTPIRDVVVTTVPPVSVTAGESAQDTITGSGWVAPETTVVVRQYEVPTGQSLVCTPDNQVGPALNPVKIDEGAWPAGKSYLTQKTLAQVQGQSGFVEETWVQGALLYTSGCLDELFPVKQATAGAGRTPSAAIYGARLPVVAG